MYFRMNGIKVDTSKPVTVNGIQWAVNQHTGLCDVFLPQSEPHWAEAGITQVQDEIIPDPKLFAVTGENPDGTLITVAVPAPTPLTQDEIVHGLEFAVSRFMDTTAMSFGYDGLIAALTYLNSTNALWQRQAAAFNAWRDAVWTTCLAVQTSARNGAQAVPSDSQLIAMLPPANIPTV